MSESMREAIPLLTAFASQALGWTPDTFWAATPADLSLAASDPTASAAPMTRADLETLMKDEAHG